MLTHMRPALTIMLLLTLLLGVIYPLSATGVAQLALPGAANGSLELRDSKVAGSTLIGQRFTSDRYFHGRASAAGTDGYDASASSGSNLGPLSKKLLDRVTADVAALPQGDAPVPADAVTTSASGLDPHVSPAFAALQVERVAKARGLTSDELTKLVAEHTSEPLWGIFGEPRVNVLQLNLSLDALPDRPVG